jgi:hypothetical protein
MRTEIFLLKKGIHNIVTHNIIICGVFLTNKASLRDMLRNITSLPCYALFELYEY